MMIDDDTLKQLLRINDELMQLTEAVPARSSTRSAISKAALRTSSHTSGRTAKI
jgi:hypothetical protein